MHFHIKFYTNKDVQYKSVRNVTFYNYRWAVNLIHKKASVAPQKHKSLMLKKTYMFSADKDQNG